MNIFQDLRYAKRQLLNRPGFAIAVIVTFALGIGATTAIFSLVSSVMLQPLPYAEPERLVHVFEQRPDGGRNTVSGGAFMDWQEHSKSFEHIAIHENARMNLTAAGEPQRLSGLRVSAPFLAAHGIQPLLGRDFAAGEDLPAGNNQVIVLTHGLWLEQFNGSHDAIGKTLVLDEQPYTVIGVLPPRILLQDEARYLVPIVINGEPSTWTREGHWRIVTARLAPGVTLQQAEVELRTIKQRLNSEYASFKQDWSVMLMSVQDLYASGISATLYVLLATVLCVLLIACANVSNLMLARGSDRTREMSVRRALGASTGRIARQVLIESVLLALLGCAAGLVVAALGVQLLSNALNGMLPYDMPDALLPELDTRVLLFSIFVSTVCGVLFGLLPALRAARSNPAGSLKESERGSQSVEKKRSQFILLASQFAFALVLLIGAGLMLRSFAELLQAEPGFQPQQALAFDLSLPESRYPDSRSRAQAAERIVERIEALPGVEAAGVTSYVPLSNRGATEYLSRMDRPFSAEYVVGYEAVSGDYLGALGLDLVQGRFLTAGDNRDGAPRVLVINERIANDLYPGENPLGQQLRFFDNAWEIVGVVESVRHQAMHLDAAPRIYSAHIRSSWSTSVVVRTVISPDQLREAVRQAVQDVDVDLPIANVRTLESAVGESLARHRVTLILLAIFAGLALVIACVGVYGVMAYTVRQRERELGIRSALGAGRGDIIRLVMHSGLKPSLLGVLAGLFAAVLLARYLESLLFEVQSHDPVVFIAAVVSLMLITILAILVPARRAASIEPMQVLRRD